MQNALQVILSKELRAKQTEAEKILWFKIRNRQLHVAKFRRQQRIGSYIVDFVCLEKRLIIEIDGGQHNEAPIKENDEQRTRWLEAKGYQIF
jgi:very-short-patch-repair endonuclease